MSSKETMHLPFTSDEAVQSPDTKPDTQADSTNPIFYPDHDLCKLWSLWSGLSCQDAPLRLEQFFEQSSQLAVAQFSSKDKYRLWDFLTAAARKRIESISAISVYAPLDLDEEAFIFFSGNEMDAWLFLFPPMGQGKQLSPSQIHKILAHQGVTFGVDWMRLWKLSSVTQRYFQLFPMAHGALPEPGQDGQILDHYPRSLQEDVHVDELDQATYTTLKLVQNIQENDIICEIIPPTPGKPGTTVTGRIIAATDGKPALVPQGRNTRLSDDGKYLLAARNGHVAFSGRNFQVKPVLHLYEKDIASKQNIKFLGDIHIHCDIGRGISICAMGMIQIDGAVECCAIEAGEDIIVSSGVQGQDKAVLHAQRSVYAKYLEHCTVYARNSIQADCIIACDIFSNGTVKARTGRGAIIGGIIRSSGQVSAITVGSKAECPTTVLLGGQPCEEAERAQVQLELENIEKSLASLEQKPHDQALEQKLSKLRLNQYVAKMKLEKFSKELETHSTLSTNRDMRRLRCDTVYPGTTVTINHSSFRVSQTQSNCVIGVVDGLVGCL